MGQTISTAVDIACYLKAISTAKTQYWVINCKNWFPVSDTNDCSHVTNNNATKRCDVIHCDVTDVTSLLQTSS